MRSLYCRGIPAAAITLFQRATWLFTLVGDLRPAWTRPARRRNRAASSRLRQRDDAAHSLLSFSTTASARRAWWRRRSGGHHLGIRHDRRDGRHVRQDRPGLGGGGASARNVPAWKLPTIGGSGAMMKSMSPARSPVTAAEVAAIRNMHHLAPISEFNSALERCWPVPMPAVPKVTPPGLAFAAAIELRDRLVRRLAGIHHDEKRKLGHGGHEVEIVDRVEAQRLVQRRRDDVPGRDEDERVAVGRRLSGSRTRDCRRRPVAPRPITG